LILHGAVYSHMNTIETMSQIDMNKAASS
jgi:hypothetical protein